MLLYFLTITLILGISCEKASISIDDTDCGPNFPVVVNGNSIYYYGLIFKGTALQAETFCHHHNMKLLSIETPEESEFLQQSLINYLDSNSKNVVVLRTSGKRYEGNKWMWEATGNPIHYTHWLPNQPDNAGGHEDCLELWYDPNSPGTIIKWNDAPCENPDRNFICEYNN